MSTTIMDEGEPITLQEALEEYEELEKQSTAVLGASDPRNCSYPKGYMKRQALYACITCNPKNSPEYQPAGVCLACSYKCHDGHELIELYTKRNFRCDCGNKKFSSNPCQLVKEKEDENSKNRYNQNFRGEYCTCHRPYPDPDAPEDEDSMVQCVICEDWHHCQHTIPGMKISEYEEGVELICGACLPKVAFVGSYTSMKAKPLDVDQTDKEAEKQSCAEGDVEKANTTDTATSKISNTEKTENVIPHPPGPGLKVEEASNGYNESEQIPLSSLSSSVTQRDEKEITNGNNDISSQKSTGAEKECVLHNSTKKFEITPGVGCLLTDGWRDKLCRCSECKVTYEAAGVSFLIDEEDTIDRYEALGKENEEIARLKAEESFNKQVNDLGHVGQIELISGYNDMKQALTEFLNGFSSTGRVVEKRDIDEFFETLQATKRRRLNQDPVV